jgi:PAS domain S-box-containing protein/putative nucleotidyltransferase with HDIG domain
MRWEDFVPDAAPPLRVLIVEDSADDAALFAHELRKAGFDIAWERVETADAMRAALRSKAWDVIISDYVVPGFGGMQALRIAKENGLDVPFIVISGKVDEETLIDAVKAGACDFLVKGRIGRLPSVIKRERALAEARQSMRQAEIHWRTAVDAVRDAIVIADAEGRIERANLAYAALAGLPVQELRGKTYWHVFPRLPAPTPQSRAAMNEGAPGEEEIRLPDGRTFLSRVFPFSERAGSGSYFLCVLQDITERDRVRAAIAASERRFRGLIEYASDLLVVVDADGKITYASPSIKRLGGYEVDEVTGRSYLEFAHPDDRAASMEGFRELLREPGALQATEHRFRRKDGNWDVLESIARNASAEPLIGGIVVNARVVTERKRAEARVERLGWALRALSQSNSALVHAQTEQELFARCCEGIAGTEGYPLAWIGFARDDPARTVELVAAAGAALDYLDGIRISWAETPEGLGPTGRVIRSGEIQIVNDFAAEPAFTPWRAKATAHGLAASISLPIRLEGKVIGALMIYSRETNAFGEAEVKLFEELAGDLSYGVATRRMRAAFEESVAERERGAVRLRASLEASIQAIAATVEARDPYTAGHEKRVAELAAAIARELGIPAFTVEGIHFGALIHDVGKIQVPAEILSKPTRLLPLEFELVKAHSQAGYDILKGIDFPWPVAEIAWAHHERLDGSGYPNGLKGEQIILEARILSVADVVEAMSSHRPYRPGLGIDKALAEIERGRASVYDPHVVDACLRLFREKHYQLPA